MNFISLKLLWLIIVIIFNHCDMTTAYCFYTTNYKIHPYNTLHHKLQTHSSAPDDGRNYCPKHVELIEIINKIIIVASSLLFILLLLLLLYYMDVSVTGISFPVLPLNQQ